MASIWKKAALPTVGEWVKEIVTKKELTLELGRVVRLLQQENVKNIVPEDAKITEGETVNNVCSVLEAVFVHGLKNKLTAKVTAVFGGSNDKMPEPDFWAVVMLCTHKDVLTEIERLSQITTDIGRCRAWLRLALNDGLIVSYIDTLLQNKASLQSYYNSSAYMRDNEQPDIMKQLLEGLCVFHFQLPFNCSILNTWHSKPLVLAGIWTPPVAPQPVMPAVDVVEFFSGREHKASTGGRTKSSSRHATAASKVQSESLSCSSQDDSSAKFELLDDRQSEIKASENKDLKNSKVQDDNPVESRQKPDGIVLCLEAGSSKHPSTQSEAVSPSCSIPDFGLEFIDPNAEFLQDEACGNKLDGKSGWSSTFEFCDELQASSPKEGHEETDSQSYDSLLQSYNRGLDKTLVVGTPELSSMMTSMMNASVEETQDSCEEPSTPELSPDFDFEIIPKILENADEKTCELISMLGVICPEQGLDTQRYRCHSCGCLVGMIYGKSRVCYFDGFNYCCECHENDECVIPSRIIHNWDFKKYPVAKRNKSFLTRVLEEPVINMKLVNPLIYSAVEDMAQLQTLRTQLSFLRSYIFTCKESIAEELRKRMWPREYLYEHVHLYCINDLLQIPSGSLIQTLQKVINFAKNHVLNCHLCNLKGFICEVCNNSKVIYPFDMDITYHCEQCLTVFHSSCMDASKSCPKCERRRKREEMGESSWCVED